MVHYFCEISVEHFQVADTNGRKLLVEKLAKRQIVINPGIRHPKSGHGLPWRVLILSALSEEGQTQVSIALMRNEFLLSSAVCTVRQAMFRSLDLTTLVCLR